MVGGEKERRRGSEEGSQFVPGSGTSIGEVLKALHRRLDKFKRDLRGTEEVREVKESVKVSEGAGKSGRRYDASPCKDLLRRILSSRCFLPLEADGFEEECIKESGQLSYKRARKDGEPSSSPSCSITLPSSIALAQRLCGPSYPLISLPIVRDIKRRPIQGERFVTKVNRVVDKSWTKEGETSVVETARLISTFFLVWKSRDRGHRGQSLPIRSSRKQEINDSVPRRVRGGAKLASPQRD